MNLLRISLLALCLLVVFTETYGRPSGKSGGKGGGKGGGGKGSGGKGHRGRSRERRMRRRDRQTRITVIDENVCGVCRAEGDPHYYPNRPVNGRTKADFQGACTYVLSDRSSDQNPECNYEVHAKNKPADGDKPSVTTTDHIKIFYDGDEIQLGPMSNIWINGIEINSCDYEPEKNFYLAYESHYCNFHIRDCNITIGWKKPNKAKVIVPKEFGDDMTGICGDCDGDTSNDCTNDAESFMENGECNFVDFAASFQVPEPTCESYTPVDVVSCSQENRQKAEEACAVTNLRNAANIFRVELQNYPFTEFEEGQILQMADAEFESCIFDWCVYEEAEDEEGKRNTVCRFATSVADALAEQFLSPDYVLPCWKAAVSCEDECGANEEFVYQLTSEMTCISDDPLSVISAEVCGCQCEPGFYRVGEKCEPSCGCFDEDGGVRDINEEYVTEGCLEKRKCVNPNDEETELLETLGGCNNPNTECGAESGKRQCVCSEGYVGDGVTCTAIDEEAPPPVVNPPEETPPGEGPPEQTPPEETPPGEGPPEEGPPEQTPPEGTPPGEAPEPCVTDPYALIFQEWTGPVKDPNKSYQECIEDDDDVHGYGYFGTEAVSRTGKTCQAWSEQTPHQHRFHNLANESNYCRNQPYKGHAGVREFGPWCFVLDSVDNWEYCDVGFCNADLNPAGPQSITAEEIGCYDPATRGTDYDGEAFMVAKAALCDQWPADYPHGDFNDNKCRNPEPDNRAMPWCFFQGAKTACRIPECVAVPDPAAPPPTCEMQFKMGVCKTEIVMKGSGCMESFNFPHAGCAFSIQQESRTEFLVSVGGNGIMIDSDSDDRSYEIEECAHIITTEPKEVVVEVAVCPICKVAAEDPLPDEDLSCFPG